MRIGFIGLGRMGANMVRRLVRDGHEIMVYNRTPEKSQEIEGEGEGAKATFSIADLVAALEKLRDQGSAHGPGRAGRQDHGHTLECAIHSTGPQPRRALEGTRDQKGRTLAYVIAEPCIGQKDNSCVEVCPVDCIHPTPDEPDYDNVEQLFIDPDECIDCDACVEACPVDACFAEDQLPAEWAKYAEINANYFKNQAA